MPLRYDLPGQEILLNDGNLLIQNANPNAKIGILGTALQGPTGLRSVADVATAATLYGSTSEVVRKVSEAFSGFGPTANVFVHRLGGKGLIFEYSKTLTLPVGVAPSSTTFGAIYNGTLYSGARLVGADTGTPSQLRLFEFHAATAEYGASQGPNTTWTGSLSLDFNGTVDPTKVFFYEIVKAGTIVASEPTIPPHPQFLSTIGGPNTLGDNGYSLANVMTYAHADDLDGKHAGATPVTSGFLGTQATLGGSITSPTYHANGALNTFTFTNPSGAPGPGNFTAIVVFYNMDFGLADSSDITETTVSDTSGEYAAWYYTGSEPWNTFYSWKQPVKELAGGIRVETIDATTGLEDKIGLFFDNTGGILKIYDLNVDSLLWSNEPNKTVDKQLVSVTIDGDLSILNPINRGVFLEMQSLSDPAPTTVPTSPDDIPVLVSDVLSLPNFYGDFALIQASNSQTTLTKRERYEALDKAYDNLLYFDLDIVVACEAYVDDPNAAYFADATRDFRHNPANGDSVLTWLKTVVDGPYKYHYWATPELEATWLTAKDRLEDEYHEVNFAYQLARFCETSTRNGRMCQGVMGSNKPKSNKTKDLLDWVGLEAIFATNGVMLSGGTGLLGNPYTVGLPAERLSPLVRERDPILGTSTGERTPGLYVTDSNEYDGLSLTDKNGFPIDMGKFASQVIDWPVFGLTGQRLGIIDVVDTFFAGFMVSLDPKISPTSKTIGRLTAVWQPGFRIEEALAKAKYVFLSNRAGRTIFVDSITMATAISDWQNSLTVRIIKAITDSLTQLGRQIEGEVLSDAERIALSRRIEEALQRFKKGGYLNSYSFEVKMKQGQGKVADLRVLLKLDVPREIKVVSWEVDLAS